MITYTMKRLGALMEWLNRNDRPREFQAPFKASALVSILSFAFIYWLDSRPLSVVRIWWEQLLIYAVIPVLLAFIILYRSAWHRELPKFARAPLLGALACLIFLGVFVGIAAGMVLFAFVYYGYLDHFARFHY